MAMVVSWNNCILVGDILALELRLSHQLIVVQLLVVRLSNLHSAVNDVLQCQVDPLLRITILIPSLKSSTMIILMLDRQFRLVQVVSVVQHLCPKLFYVDRLMLTAKSGNEGH
jgi:hypothetical protein